MEVLIIAGGAAVAVVAVIAELALGARRAGLR